MERRATEPAPRTEAAVRFEEAGTEVATVGTGIGVPVGIVVAAELAGTVIEAELVGTAVVAAVAPAGKVEAKSSGNVGPAIGRQTVGTLVGCAGSFAELSGSVEIGSGGHEDLVGSPACTETAVDSGRATQRVACCPLGHRRSGPFAASVAD